MIKINHDLTESIGTRGDNPQKPKRMLSGRKYRGWERTAYYAPLDSVRYVAVDHSMARDVIDELIAQVKAAAGIGKQSAPAPKPKADDKS
jgi:hypothetical protein